MIRAVGLIPGVESLGRRNDPLARSGLGFAREHNGVRDEIIFSPETSAVLYEKSTLVKLGAFEGWPVGTEVSRWLLLEQRVVDTPPKQFVEKLERDP
ncbi:MAG: hypothetical protein WAP35_08885 [Solirubrobacterales bacterium]